MPHVIVKLWPGKSQQEKQKLSDAITQNVIDILGMQEESVSVAIQEVNAEDWKEKVYKADITANSELLYKKPGYKM